MSKLETASRVPDSHIPIGDFLLPILIATLQLGESGTTTRISKYGKAENENK